MTASDNKCVRNPIQTNPNPKKGIQINYMLGAINHSELAGGDDLYLAQNLKYLREQKGMNQQHLAEILGVEQRTISSWECENREPGIDMVTSIAKFFDISLDDLILRDLRPPIPIYASNLAYLRKLHGMTQEDMANLLGFKSQCSVSFAEKGERQLSVENLEKISDFFGVTMDQLVKKDLSKGAE